MTRRPPTAAAGRAAWWRRRPAIVALAVIVCGLPVVLLAPTSAAQPHRSPTPTTSAATTSPTSASSTFTPPAGAATATVPPATAPTTPSSSTPSSPTPSSSAPSEAPTAAEAAGWLHTDGATIVTSNGQPFVIKAVSWFGMETSTCAPHGLSTVAMSQLLDDVADWGFNTIRLPYANACLEPSAATSSINPQVNPDLVGLTPLQLMDKIVAGAHARGLRVILDQHRFTTTSQSPLWYAPGWTEQQWIADWTMLAARYADDPTVIGADLHNEPADPACWGCGVASEDWAAAATRAGDAIQAVNPHLLIIVEGVEHEGNGSYTWWGGGLSDVAADPIALTVADQVVYSPHDYPDSVYPQPWFSATNYPADLDQVWTANWGYLAIENIAPVFVGEFGTELQTTSDKEWLASLVEYLATNHLSFGYWDLNPDSGDTGGLLADNWTTPETAKLAALAQLLGTAPAAPSAAADDPTEPVTVYDHRQCRAQVTATVQSSWAGGYVAQLSVFAADAAATGWAAAWPDPRARAITSAWGLTCRVSGGWVRCRSAGWASALSPGERADVGVQVATTGPPPAHLAVTVTG